ncbi:hypothetical protein [Cellulomonas sp.]|uniref:hypothetical protein n=1 Tax=Cellulomonas sp. TaxID=40001 RepID=UPI003BAAAD11
MRSMWETSAASLVQSDEPGWAPLWELLDAGSHAALALSLATPLGLRVDLAFAAIELGEARDELEWTREELTARAPARLGPLHIGEPVEDARRVVDRLIEAAIERVLLLADEATPEELGCLARVLQKLHAAARESARAAV